MFTYLIIVLISFFFGWSLSLYFNFIDNLVKRTAFSILIGFISATWLSLFFSWLFFRQLGQASTLITIVILLAAAIHLYFRARVNVDIGHHPRVMLAVIASVICVYIFLNLSSVLFTNERGGWSGILSVHGDYPFHIGLINSFVLRNNFPPQYPVLAGSPLTYPFAVDFLTALFVKNGMGLREAIWFVNIWLFFCLAVLIFHLAEKFSSSSRVAAITLLLFLFNGNAGVINALGEAVKNPAILLRPGSDFSNDYANGLFFMNIIYAVFIPQRSTLLGFTAAVLVYLLLFNNFSEGRQRERELLLAGVLSGLLPLMHAHSFIAVIIAASLLFLFRPSRAWLYFAMPIALLAAPQVLWISQRAGSQTFFGVNIGWVSSNADRSLFDILLFWLANGWVVFVLSFAGMAVASRKHRVFYTAFIAIFLAGNIIRFQPWDWDNYKILMHWYLFASIFAAAAIMKLFDAGAGLRTHQRETGKRLFASLYRNGFRALAVMLVVSGIASGVLTVLWMATGDNARKEVFPPLDLEFAEWVKENTPSSAVFLTGDAHNNAIHSIAGRQIVMGPWWWRFSHGLNAPDIERDVKEIYATGNCELIRKYRIDYIVAGQEDSKFNPNIDLFESRFEKVFPEPGALHIYNIYKTKC